MKAAAYLEFQGNAKEVIDSYQAIFDAELICEHAYTAEMAPGQELTGKVFHAELRIGDLNLYLSDSVSSPDFGSLKFVVEIPEEDRAREVYGKIVQSGKAISDFHKIPVGPTIAQAEDQFGIKWEVVIC